MCLIILLVMVILVGFISGLIRCCRFRFIIMVSGCCLILWCLSLVWCSLWCRWCMRLVSRLLS